MKSMRKMRTTKSRSNRASVPTRYQLVHEILVEHQQVEGHLRDTLLHARRAGALLLEVKGRVKHGEWGRWIDVHLGISWRTVNLYIRIARHWEMLANSQGLAKMSLTAATQLISLSEAGEYKERAAELEQWAVLDAADLEGLSAREAAAIVTEVREAYLDLVDDPEREKSVQPDRPLRISPRTLLVRGHEAVVALKEGKISVAQVRRRIRLEERLVKPKQDGDKVHPVVVHTLTPLGRYVERAEQFVAETRGLLHASQGVLQERVFPRDKGQRDALRRLIGDVRRAVDQLALDVDVVEVSPQTYGATVAKVGTTS